jgi:hypothetical protein
VSLEKVVPKDIFLSTIKVFKYDSEQKPVLVKEILCESNLKPAMDYGPSVAFFSDSIYYFKRIVKLESGTHQQLYKYDFAKNEENELTGCQFTEEEDCETKI